MIRHFRRAADITVALPPTPAIALFTPEGERSWAGKDGWDPRYPAPSHASGAGAVFITGPGEATTVWLMVDHDRHRVRYARVSPDRLAGTVEVRVVAHTPDSTDVRVTYELTALTAEAGEELAVFAANFDAEIASWATDISAALGGEQALAVGDRPDGHGWQA